MSRPKVLVFIDWYLPGYRAGGPVRSLANIVDHLRHRIDFHIVTGDTDYTTTTPYVGIIPDTWTELPGGEKVWYASRTGINRAAWRERIVEKEWNAIYINGLYSRHFSIEPLRLTRGTRTHRVLAVRGMLASGPMRHGRLKKRAFLALARNTGLFKKVHFQATNEEEAADIRRWIAADAQVSVVPNLPRKLVVQAPAMRVKEPGILRLISVARIAVEKNTMLAIEALQGIQGEVTFDLYGPIHDEGYWSRCQKVIATLPKNIRVIHHGSIPPEEVPRTLSNAHALFMPSAGENFGHTMLEALAQGVPLLISDRTPWRGLQELGAGWDLPLNRKAGFSEALSLLVEMDQKTYEGHSKAAFRLAQRSLNDPETVERTYRLFIQ